MKCEIIDFKGYVKSVSTMDGKKIVDKSLAEDFISSLLSRPYDVKYWSKIPDPFPPFDK